ncbi:MAG: thiamine phosphate synthase [Actinomycetota bacterium]
MRLHAIVTDIETARAAVAGGATVVQLRLKGATFEEVVVAGRGFRDLPATFVVNDDVDAAIALGADGVHLGREDVGAKRAVRAGLLLGISASSVEEARAGQAAGAGYIGAGPVWATVSKLDADPPVGLDGLAAICRAVSIPVVAIGGIDASNAADCLAAGAAGVAVVRAAANAKAVSEALGDR